MKAWAGNSMLPIYSCSRIKVVGGNPDLSCARGVLEIPSCSIVSSLEFGNSTVMEGSGTIMGSNNAVMGRSVTSSNGTAMIRSNSTLQTPNFGTNSTLLETQSCTAQDQNLVSNILDQSLAGEFCFACDSAGSVDDDIASMPINAQCDARFGCNNIAVVPSVCQIETNGLVTGDVTIPDRAVACPCASPSPIVSVAPAQSTTVFKLKGAKIGSCTAVYPNAVDVNIGDSWEDFITAAYCQVHGRLPIQADFDYWSNLKLNPRGRRIDVIMIMCQPAAGTVCNLKWSDPWVNGETVLTAPACQRKTKRDLGAVFMFFYYCPNDDPRNCAMSWANTHSYGSNTPSSLYSNGYYNPANTGFWFGEFRDAIQAGLQFLLPNVFGPDLYNKPTVMASVNSALDALNGGIKLGLFDDTSTWGAAWVKQYEPTNFGYVPNVYDVETTAQDLYKKMWRPFFTGLKRQYWYLVDGRPYIFYYNGRALKPWAAMTPILKRMKELFNAEFGVVPYIAQDISFPADGGTGFVPNDGVASASFHWDTFFANNFYFVSPFGSHANCMVKWDAKSRDTPWMTLQPSDRVQKGPELLQTFLDATTNTQVVVLETWNDLGEGTGINRNYDYYYKGQWLAPDYFMKITRRAQCSN